MADHQVTVGQRWISETEAHLGLGIVLEIENRRVTVSFPAAGDRRTYALNNAPISRVQYQVGERVSNAQEEWITIHEVIEEDGCLIYLGATDEGEEAEFAEYELNSFVQFSTPKARLLSGQIDNLQRFKLRHQTLHHQRRHQQSKVMGLMGARVELLPHQLYIAQEASSRFAPRILLADEVGLGKTIEAGLILHQQLISGRAQRALILVPDSLVHQWLVEMLRRFNLSFTILDEERCNALVESGEENPFESAQLVLCPLSLLTENEARQAQAEAAEWDLLLVDEAHHLHWSPEAPSAAYESVEALARIARGVLLLTATPEQLGIESHFARLRLLDPDRYYDLESFKEEEEHYQPVNHLVQQLLALADSPADHPLTNELLEELRDYLDDDVVEQFQQLCAAEEHLEAVEQVTHQLLDRHGTGRVLFRNTRNTVSGFPERQLVAHPLTAPEGWSDLAEQSNTITDLLQPEQLLGSDWLTQDPRVSWLEQWLKQERPSKVLLICADAESALDLEAHLRLRSGFATAVFHEGLSLVNRDRAAAYFADSEEGAQILVCSEIGSEGRNFQFAHHLVLFDLPLNPDLLEQRIGRLDRIGQRHTVEIHVPYYQESASEVLLQWYDQGVNAFKRAAPAAQVLFQRFAEPLQAALLGDRDSFPALLEQTQQTNRELLADLEAGRDRLLELNSCNQTKAEAIVEAVSLEENHKELADYMDRLFDQFGVDQDRHSPVSVVLRPSDHMITHHFPGLPEDGVTATYQRSMALSREDIEFLSWEHPMVSGAMDMVLSGDFGNTSMATMKLPPLKPGTLLVEAIFVLHCSAPAELQLYRYLPLTTVRKVLDSNGNDLSHILTEDKLNPRLEKVPRRTAQELIRHAKPQISELVDKIEAAAEPQQQEMIDEALATMQREQSAELSRLIALAKVNPNIRPDEITHLSEESALLAEAISHAQLKLDALRVVLIT